MTDPEKGPAKQDPVAELILRMLKDAGPGQTVSPTEVAQAFAGERQKPGDPADAWRRYMNAVRQQALHLARRGEIEILRKGAPVDPSAPFRGLVKLALPRGDDS